jgi:hypothetical protein
MPREPFDPMEHVARGALELAACAVLALAFAAIVGCCTQ